MSGPSNRDLSLSRGNCRGVDGSNVRLAIARAGYRAAEYLRCALVHESVAPLSASEPGTM